MINTFVAASISFVDGGVQSAAPTNARGTSANAGMPRPLKLQTSISGLNVTTVSSISQS